MCGFLIQYYPAHVQKHATLPRCSSVQFRFVDSRTSTGYTQSVLSIRFKVGGYLGMAPAGVILEVQSFFSLENF